MGDVKRAVVGGNKKPEPVAEVIDVESKMKSKEKAKERAVSRGALGAARSLLSGSYSGFTEGKLG